MKLTAEIRAYGDPEKLYSCFKPELVDKKRSDFEIKKKKNYLLFEIEAEDSVALRATMHGITKLLIVYEKVNKVKNG